MKDIKLKRVRHLSGYVTFSLIGLLIFVLILSFEVSLPLLLLLICIIFVLVYVIYLLLKNFRINRLYVYILLVLFTSLIIKRIALESFKIPSRSMETTLAVGDRILVTKVFRRIQNGEIIVFKNTWLNNNENLIKRCLGLPGDSIRIDSGTIFVNSENRDHYPGISKIYKIRFNNKVNLLTCARLYTAVSTNWPGMETHIQLANNQMDSFFFRFSQSLVFKEVADAEDIGRLDSSLTCTENMNSFRLPEKGDSVMLFRGNIVDWVKRISGAEKDSLRLIRDKIKRGEMEQAKYCFKENYYFVAGDNRCRSSDSRLNGLIPESSIIGSAAFIFFSLDPDANFPFNFRVNRIFKAF